MPPLESATLPTTAPAQRWSGRKKQASSNSQVLDQQFNPDVSRKVRFFSEESSSSQTESERRQWNRHQDDDDDDVSTLTDVFHGYDIEAPKRRRGDDDDDDDDEERQPVTLDPLNDDTSLDKMLEGGYLPSDDCLSPFGERGLGLPAYHETCEDVVLQIGEIVDTVKNCGPSIFARKNTSANSIKAPREPTSFFASLWESTRRFLDPPTPPPIPTVLSSENTMEIYPDSSISFAEGEAPVMAPAENTSQEKETDDYNPGQQGLSRRGLLENVNERSSDDSPSDEARPSPTDQSRKTLESSGVFGLSETSNASVSITEEDAPRPYGHSMQRRSRCFVFFLAILAITIVCGVGFGIMAENNQKSQRHQIEEKLTRFDPTTTSWPTSSPSHDVKESSPATIIPATSTLSQTTSPSAAPSVNPSDLPSLAPSLPATRYPSVAPSGIPTQTPTEVSSNSPTLTPSGSPTDVITTTMPTINPIESAQMLLPDYPNFRFVPWKNLTVSFQLMLQQILGYDESTWNLPGTVNNNGADYSRFWEAQSFSTIQHTASIEVLSALAILGFQKSQWDCWINHYQNFTWTELETLSPISMNILAGSFSKNALNETGNDLVVVGSDLQMAMSTFGWTENNWATLERFQYFFPTAEEGLGARSKWDDLTMREKLAATRLCYTQELWDRVPLK